MDLQYGFRIPEDNEKEIWLLFKGDKILTQLEKTQFILSDQELQKLNIRLEKKHYLADLDGNPCYAAELEKDAIVPDGMAFHSLRGLLGLISDELFSLAGRAYHILQWDRKHRYCSQCGAQMEPKGDERAKICPACGLVDYPRISPAIIVAITKGNEILLARGSRFPAAFYSTLAGFVEPGETFEDCVRREVGEEVGIKVKNIRYFGSQPWPFPDSLMVGFTAEYESGELVLDKTEILDADWFKVGQLPQLPNQGSIASRLIQWFVETGGSEG